MTFLRCHYQKLRTTGWEKLPALPVNLVFFQKQDKIQERVGKDNREASCFGMKDGEGSSKSMQREADPRHLSWKWVEEPSQEEAIMSARLLN